MTTTTTNLDLSPLPVPARREVRDFYLFLLARYQTAKNPPLTPPGKRRFSDLCGGLAWQGDALAWQRSLRDGGWPHS